MKTIFTIVLLTLLAITAKAQVLSSPDSTYSVADSIIHEQVKTDLTIHKNYLLDLEATSGEISQFRNVQSVYNWLIARDAYLNNKKKLNELKARKENAKNKKGQ